MELLISERRGEGFQEVSVSYRGEVLRWATPLFSKVRLANVDGVFGDFNEYLKEVSESAKAEVWEHYKTIHEILIDPNDTRDPGSESVSMNSFIIQQNIKRITERFNMDDMRRFLLTKTNLFIPPDTLDRLDQSGGRYPDPDQTYLKDDYINLATLSLALRPLVPIWGEFLNQGGMGLGDDLYKELEAYSLIAGTGLLTWPEVPVEGSDELLVQGTKDKLERYIEIRVENPNGRGLGKAGNEAALKMFLWKGIPSSEVAIRLLAMVFVRRLTIIPLTDRRVGANIVANVHNYVKTKLTPQDSRSERIQAKRSEDGGFSEEDSNNTGILEEYKIKQRAAEGDIVLHEVYSKDVVRMVQHVDPTIDLKHLERTMRSIPRLSNVRINEHQILLGQWVMAKCFPARAWHYVHKPTTMRLVVATQALLWHWGFLDLACLMVVRRVAVEEGEFAIGLSEGTQPLKRFNRDRQEEMVEHFPHQFPQTGRNPDPKQGNVAVIGAAKLTDHIFSGTWEYLGSKVLYRQAGYLEGRRLLTVPLDIKNNISDLIIKLAEINQ